MHGLGITWINGPTSSADQLHNRHSKAVMSVPVRRRFLQWHRGGPTAPPHRRADRDRHKILTFNRLMCKVQECLSREAVDHRANRTSSSGHTYENGPTRSSTSLAYKRSLTPAGTDIQRWSISFPHFCSVRVGLV
jgi:hypothetical protein